MPLLSQARAEGRTGFICSSRLDAKPWYSAVSAAPSVDLRTIKPGAHVNFTMQQGGDGMYVIQSVTPAGGGH